MSQAEQPAGGREGLEADLIAVAERRDRDAFGRLFAFYAPRVKAYLGRLGVADGVAEGLAEEAMLALWRRAPRSDPRDAAPSTLVFALAREARAAARDGGRPEFDRDDPALVPAVDGAVPPPAVEVSQAVRRVIDLLPLEQAADLSIFYNDERPRAAGGAARADPAGDVDRRLRLALGRLRALLGQG